jgi:hypothetical protein
MKKPELKNENLMSDSLLEEAAFVSNKYCMTVYSTCNKNQDDGFYL